MLRWRSLPQSWRSPKTMKHVKSCKALPNGAGQIVCSCGYATPSVDESSAFTLGRKQKTVDQYFAEHLAQVETTMVDPAPEKAIAPAQHATARKPKQEKRA